MAKRASRIPFSPLQRKILLVLASSVGLRMLGIFLVLPVFTLYGLQFTDSRFLVGLAFGCYGLTMAILQIPLGRLSDRIGRRKVLVGGMAVFALGSFLCAIPDWFPRSVQIYELILARLVQGGGAIVSTAFAAVADSVEAENRSFAMAALGIPIGAAFMVGVIGGPLLAGAVNTEFLFWLTGFLGLGAVVLLRRSLPSIRTENPPPPAPLGAVLARKPLPPLVLAGFLINFFMSAFFFYFPLIVTRQHHLKMNHYYVLLLPMLVASGVTTFIFSWLADRGLARILAAALFLCLLLSGGLLFRPELAGFDPQHLTGVLVAGIFFFVGFTGLEPILPSLVSKSSPASAYGTSLGVYNTLQFLGSFAGASVAGAVAGQASSRILGILLAASLLGFLLMAFGPQARAD
jgi:MFS family permease